MASIPPGPAYFRRHRFRDLLYRLLGAALLVFAGATFGGHLPTTLSISANVTSYPLSQSLLYVADPARELTIESLAGNATPAHFKFSSFDSSDINFGYSSAVHWLALPLTLAANAPKRWLLEIAYSSLDHVEVYTPKPGGGFERQAAGDHQPASERPYPHRNLVFPLQLVPGATQTVYLRVESAGNLTIPATLWRPEALHAHDQRSYAILSIYYGMLFALLLYNLLLFISTPDRTFIAYVAFVTAMAVGQASMNGFGNQFAWPDWPGWGNIALPSGMAATGFFAALFTRLFFNTRRTFVNLDRVLMALAAVFAASALAPLFVSYRAAAIFVSVTGLAGSLIFTAAGIYCLAHRHPGARYYLIAWVLLLVGVAVLAMRNLGWLPTNTLTLYAMQIGSALEMLLLSFALADRLNVMRREKELATQEAMLAKQTVVETLRRNEAELESRVAQRTRDLEQANTQLREKERQLEHLARHDPLTGLANRAMLDDRLTQIIARARRNNRSAALLLVDLDNFKQVNDMHGHAVGDQLLIAVGRRLLKSLRATDTVARFGGDEFVILMEDLSNRDETKRVAEKLVVEIARPYDLEPGRINISVSIGAARFPQDAEDHGQLLKRADQAMYAAKSAGRNGWRAAAELGNAATAAS